MLVKIVFDVEGREKGSDNSLPELQPTSNTLITPAQPLPFCIMPIATGD
jgi:hypothetical protein